jgi:hypothetical protein
VQAAQSIPAGRGGLWGARAVHPPPFRLAEPIADPEQSNRQLQYDGKTMFCGNRIIRRDRLLIAARRDEAATKDSV